MNPNLNCELHYYTCPTCGATKKVAVRRGHEVMRDLPCGWRGCLDRLLLDGSAGVS